MVVPEQRDRVLVSYITLRRTVGILGVSLPVILAAGHFLENADIVLLPSISAYYETGMRDLLVGVLFAIGFFLFSYRGYDRRDDIAGDLACLFALAIALFPSTSPSSSVRAVHFIAAPSLFTVLAYFSLFLFTKTAAGTEPTKAKRHRNKVYVTCGVILILCIIGVAVAYALPSDATSSRVRPVFWLESLALWAFGTSWFVKGRTILKDQDPRS